MMYPSGKLLIIFNILGKDVSIISILIEKPSYVFEKSKKLRVVGLNKIGIMNLIRIKQTKSICFTSFERRIYTKLS